MRRRELMLLLGGAMIAPRALRAQQKAMPVIGFLGMTSPGPFAPFVAAFRQGLSETGYVEGQNLAIEYRWAEGSYDRLPALAADLVGRKVDLIATSGGPPSARAAKNASSTIPIVFIASDPVELGLVASFAKPGGNLTGVSTMLAELTAKRLELLSELVPQAKVIALLLNPSNGNAERIMEDAREAAREKGLQLHLLKAGSESEIDIAFATLAQLHVGALLVGNDGILQQPARSTRGAGIAPCRSRNLRGAGIRRLRRADQLWTEPHGCVSPARNVRRKDPQRRQASRSAGRAAGDIRAGRQYEDRRGGRPDDPAIDPRARRRGDRVMN